MITHAELKLNLVYNPETGIFRWASTGKGRSSSSCGTVTNHGYVSICFKRKRYLAHVLAWFYVYGEWPSKEIDHKNRNTQDNRIDNLRLALHGQNLANAKRRTDNTSGCRGVCWDKQKQKWKVQVSIGPMRRIQKHFVEKQDAIDFYTQTANSLFGQFAPDQSAYQT